ncbi:MAG: DegT/DnrJ/EryC1/StrS family aminotransferase, partial [Acidobacteria bacterium]|nr:DegT/DnrJ/EryC1/StrS family aminotransferase [Acidobacteriota bacterium]
ECVRDPDTGKLMNRETRSFVTAVVPVHLYGQMADMDPILELARHFNLFVVEDACQAHCAAYYSGKQFRLMKAGSMGLAAAFSFYPGKNLGACGEAGAVTTNDSSIAARVQILRDHGQPQKYRHEIEGYNGRLDAIQAGILLVKLSHLQKWNQRRRTLATQYDQLLRSQTDKIIPPYEISRCASVYHLYVIRTLYRDHLQARLAEANIETQIHYPKPLHLLKPYAHLGYRTGDFPVAERTANQILSLPMYPHLPFPRVPPPFSRRAPVLSKEMILPESKGPGEKSGLIWITRRMSPSLHRSSTN